MVKPLHLFVTIPLFKTLQYVHYLMHIQNRIKPNLIYQNFEDCDVTQVILGQSSRQAK